MLPATVENRTKAGVFSPGRLKTSARRDVGERLVVLEKAMSAEAASVDDPFGNALMVEVEDLFAEVEVLQQRSDRAGRLERVLIVCDRDALLRRQPSPGI